MDFVDIPYDILYDILIDIRNLKELVLSNKKLSLYITNIFNTFINKFNGLVTDWKHNYDKLLERLVKRNDFDALKFLGNNFVTPEFVLKSTIMYGSIELLNKVSNYFSINESSENLMIYAAEGDNISLFKYFVDKGYGYSIKDIIEHAAKNNSIEIIKYLNEITGGLDNKLLEIIGDYSSKYGYLDLYKFINKKIDTRHFVINALNHHQYNIVKYALDNGLYIDSIRFYAVLGHDVEIIEYAVNKGANVNNILTQACDLVYFDIIKYALSHGADNLEEAGEILAEKNYYYISEYFIKNYNNIAMLNIFSYVSVKNNNYNIIELAFQHGANNQNDVAMNASYFGYVDIIKIAFKYGADNASKCAKIAAGEGFYDIVKFLNENYTINIESAIKKAKNKNFVYIVDYLKNFLVQQS